MSTLPKTMPLVPLSELTDFARLGLALRKAQRAYMRAVADQPSIPAADECRRMWAAERMFDEAVRKALQQERVPLPGMTGEGGGS